MDEQNVRGNPYFTKEQRGQYPYLTRDIQCDVLVVGGGATGAIVAHYFAKNNIDTVVIEKSRVGHGSTSITTALLQYELDDRAVDLLPILGEQAIRCSYQLGQFALQQLEDFIGRTGNRCQYGKVDSLLYTAKEGEVGQIETEYQYRKEWGFSVELVNPKCHPYGLSLTAGLLAKGGGAVVNPYQFTHQLLEEACKEGARVYENSAAVKVNHQQDGVVVETVFGHKITCKKVICATGYNTSLFTQRNFANQYATFNLVTQPIPHLNPALKGVVIRDNSDPYHYLRTTADGRVMVGGEDVPFQPDFQQEGVRQKSLDRLHQYLYQSMGEKVGVDYEYGGTFATTKDNLGYIGPDPKHKNLWYTLGYGANGILFAILGGYFLSRYYAGKRDEDMALFRVDRFDG